jgi:hypothetical protein
VLTEQGEHAEAIALLTPAESPMRETFTGGNAYRTALLLTSLGRARAGLGYDADRFALAEANLLEAHAMYLDTRGAEHEDTEECVEALVDLYTAWNEAEPEGGYDAKAAEWRAKLANATSGD